MKTVFSNSEICHIFARQSQTEGRTSNSSIFFRNNVIYSYGHHFPMCAIVGNLAVITHRSYSNTTAKHLIKVRQAVSHYTKVFCFNPEDAVKGYHKENLNDFVKDIKFSLSKVPTARKKSNYLREAINYALSLRAYVSSFPESEVILSEMGEGFEHYISESFLTNREIEYRAAKEKEASPKISKPKDPIKAAAKLEKLAAKVAEYKAGYCTAWIENRLDSFNESFTKEVKNQVKKTATGYNNRYHGEYRFTEWLISQGTTGNVLLRTNNGNLETSKGIKIPLPIAKRYFNQFKAGTLGAEISGYRINERETDKLHLVVGCHTIEVKHIESFATSQNWL